MQKKMSFYIFIFMLSATLTSALFPYPIFSSYTNLTEKNILAINNYFETEPIQTSNLTPQILNLDFKQINTLLPNTFEIIDLETENNFTVKRVGGKNHIDIIFDESDKTDFLSICKQWNWERRPVLAKANELTFFPASISCYPHGYQSHFCLHFKNSKTDGTCQIDKEHQKTVENARAYGFDYISN